MCTKIIPFDQFYEYRQDYDGGLFRLPGHFFSGIFPTSLSSEFLPLLPFSIVFKCNEHVFVYTELTVLDRWTLTFTLIVLDSRPDRWK